MELYIVYGDSGLLYVSRNLRCAKDAMNDFNARKIVRIELPNEVGINQGRVECRITALYKRNPWSNEIYCFMEEH